MGIGGIVGTEKGKEVKYVPVKETYAQMQARVNKQGPLSLSRGTDVKYYTADGKKQVGSYKYIGDALGGNVELNDGKKTCVAENYMSQLHNNVNYGTPVKFSYCYEDKQK